MQIIKTNLDLPTPTYATQDSVGLDLYANLTDVAHISPRCSKMIGTGIKAAIPVGYAGLLFPRSGKGSKGMKLKNTIGVIDSDYRGEIMANIFNYEQDPITVEPGERFVQLMLVPIYRASVAVVEVLPETERGEGGFGSTGSK